MSQSKQECFGQIAPSVSVLIPMHNAEAFILSALNSILREQRIALEVIVINDCSTDRSVLEVAKVKDERVQLIHSDGSGIAATLNTGLSHAQGEVIVRCDADDFYPHDRLFQQVSWLQAHPDYGAICGSYIAVDSDGNTVISLGVAESGDITEELQQGITRTHLGTFAIRAEVMQKIGGFRRYFVTAEDIDLQLRLANACRVWYEPENCYFYRIHGASITHTQKSNERVFFEAIARKFQQQRQLNGFDDLDSGCPPVPPAHEDKPFCAKRHIQGFLLGQAWQVFQQGNKWQALKIGLRALSTAPGNFAVWRSMVAMVVKSVVAV